MLVKEQLRALPSQPGVYLFKDDRGNILYVGKAASLRHRVRSYFAPGADLTPKLVRLVSRVVDLDFFVTTTEAEALILECHLIKRHHPKYNVRLKDDKTYPYLKVDLREEWPRLYFTRRWEQDGSHYFGPFASASSVRTTLDVLKKLFPFRSCTRKITGADRRACIEYDIQRCLGPCIGAAGKEEYGRVVDRVILFLEGKDETIKEELRRQMEAASEALNFEQAARLRDELLAVDKMTQRQKLATTLGDLDVVGLARAQDLAYAQVFFIRQGKLLGKEAFVLEGTREEGEKGIMTSFVKLFYAASPNIPPLLLLQHPVEEAELIAHWLGGRRGSPVAVEVPQEGERRELVEMVAENARMGLEHHRIRRLQSPEALSQALEELAQNLQLPHPPERVECYDISNIQGEWAVGSLVVFEGGRPKPAHYRRFRIRAVAGADDYAMLQEVLRRRFKRGKDEAETPWAILPDLLLVDGGRGQLNTALEVMAEAGVTVPAASLAKEREEIYLPQLAQPIQISPSPALYLVQRIRDEAHRFALSYHIKVRRKAIIASALDEIQGIGPKRKRALLRRFGSLQAIREAPLEEIASVPAMTQKLAKKVKEYL